MNHLINIDPIFNLASNIQIEKGINRDEPGDFNSASANPADKCEKASEDFTLVMNSIALACKMISSKISKAGLYNTGCRGRLTLRVTNRKNWT